MASVQLIYTYQADDQTPASQATSTMPGGRTQGKVDGYRFCCYRCDLDRKSAHEIARHWKDGRHATAGVYEKDRIWRYKSDDGQDSATPLHPENYQKPIPSYRDWLANLDTVSPSNVASGPAGTASADSQTTTTAVSSSALGRVTRQRSNSKLPTQRSRALSQTSTDSAPTTSASPEPEFPSTTIRTTRRKREVSEIDSSPDSTVIPAAQTTKRPKLTLHLTMPTITDTGDEAVTSSSKAKEDNTKAPSTQGEKEVAGASKSASTDAVKPAAQEPLAPWQRTTHSKKKGPPQVSAQHIRAAIAAQEKKKQQSKATTTTLAIIAESRLQIDVGPSSNNKRTRSNTEAIDGEDDATSPPGNKRNKLDLPVIKTHDNQEPARVPERPTLVTTQYDIHSAYERANDLTSGRGVGRTRMPRTTEMARQLLMGVLPPKLSNTWNPKFKPPAALLAYTAAYDTLSEQNEYIEYLVMLKETQAESIDSLRREKMELEKQLALARE